VGMNILRKIDGEKLDTIKDTIMHNPRTIGELIDCYENLVNCLKPA